LEALLNAQRQAQQGELSDRAWIESNLWIRDKHRRVVRLVLNQVQRDYDQYRTARDIILKARQEGFTTFIEALFFCDCIRRENTVSVLVAHDLDSAQKIFEIGKLYWQMLPAIEKLRVGEPSRENKREFIWPNGSRLYCGTAESGRFGHGLTIHNLHCSEVSRWTNPKEALIALLGAVPADGRIVLESTANGIGNEFHRMWLETRNPGSRFTGHFYTWFEHPEYSAAVPADMAPLAPDEQALVRRYHVTLGQIQWRRLMQHDLRDRFKEQYPEDDMSCFLASTRAVFDLEALSRMAARIAGEPKPESITSLRTSGDQSLSLAPAHLLVWKRPQPQAVYVIGADIGEGLPDGDASCAVVIEHRSGEQVAELHGRVPPDRFGHLLDALGRRYNRALLAVERNNHGHSTLNTLRNSCRYPRLYYHMRYDARTGTQPILGWPTDQATKPILVDDLAAAISEGSMVIHSEGLVGECMTFVAKPTGQEAEEGAYDDRVMAAGIAWQARKRAVARWTSQRPEGL
jgi:hypothetical protein